LSELLNNACKYTPEEGEIVLSVCYKLGSSWQSEELGQGVAVAISFTINNQAEIPQTELPHIFEKFYRVPGADRWKQGGTGLGLALVQNLVKTLQGTIQVESSEGWTSFIVQVTATVVEETP